MVGERGPEVFVPRSSGQVVPNNALGAVNNVTVNVNMSGGNAQTSVRGNGNAAELGRVIAAAVDQAIMRQQRPGGSLA